MTSIHIIIDDAEEARLICEALRLLKYVLDNSTGSNLCQDISGHHINDDYTDVPYDRVWRVDYLLKVIGR